MSNIIISPCDTPLNVDVLGIEHNENDLVYWLQLPDSLFTTASVLFGLVDPLDIKALIEVRLEEDATQTGLQHEEESCLEYLKAIANLCEELNTRCHLTLHSVDPEKLVTPKPAESVGAHQTSISDNCFQPTKAVQESNKPLPLDIGNSFTSKELKPLEMLKSDFHILDLKKQCAQSEVDMLSEAIVHISEFHHNDDGTTDTDESDSPDAWSDDWMSTSSPSSSSLLLS
ncbi:hypothetical protein BD769DRAFT_1385501 [Suillus cothurnatus]|nr:hypothetical protein BD769DRAFT_1385501 [Suillus cothurnatus]